MANCSSRFAIPARDCRRARPNASLTHSLQPREAGLAWGCRSAAQSLSLTAADYGPRPTPGAAPLLTSHFPVPRHSNGDPGPPNRHGGAAGNRGLTVILNFGGTFTRDCSSVQVSPPF